MLAENSRVLITGACGSIGAGLVGKLLCDGHVVCAYDQSEDGLFHLDQKYSSSYGKKLKLFVGSVRDEGRLTRALEGVDVIFHCAALKHVYLSEYNPFEAMQTNIIGTNNVINCAIDANVGRVVFTSSDKAVNPSSTMGATKLLGERLITAANNYSGNHKTKFASVRFGNVLNTNGSVVQIFKSQMEAGVPLTITSSKMSRFFITLSQSIDLCLYAASNMVGGEIFVMSMGGSNIMDFAKAVYGNKSFKYEVIGQKPGEKLYEELVTDGEAKRTMRKDDLYIIIPDTLEMMNPAIVNDYKEVYGDVDCLVESLRSDHNLLSYAEISSVLRSEGLI